MTLQVLICILTSLQAPQPVKTARWMLHYSKVYSDVPIELVVAVSKHESELTDINSFNPSKDWGIMQINWRWEPYCKAMFNRKCTTKRRIYCGYCRSTKRFQDNIRMGFHVLYLGINKPWGMLRNYNYNNKDHAKKVKQILKDVLSFRSKCRSRLQ
jgi:hypothetical protein